MLVRDWSENVGHGDHRFRRINDLVPERGVDADGDAIAGDRFLRLDGHRLDADVDERLRLDAEGDEQIQTRAARADVAPEPEHHAALVFLGDADAGG